jgi:hypothetical protein
MREMYPEANMDTRIATSVADVEGARGLPRQAVSDGTLVYIRGIGEVCFFDNDSVATDAAGIAYVPTFVSDTAEYQDDPASIAGRLLVHSRGLGTAAPLTGMYLPVRVATTAALVATLAADNVTLEADANGAMGTIDGVTMAVGDRVLVKSQTAEEANGIYVITSLGGASAKYSLVRAPDMFTAASVVPEALVPVLSGAVNAGKVFAVVATTPVTLGTTDITFRAMSLASGAYAPARAATTANLTATLAGDNITLEANANGALGAIDGVTLAVGDRVLIKAQTSAAANGIYVVSSLGGVSSKYKFIRSDDMRSGSAVIPGAEVSVLEGTVAAGKDFVVVATAPVTLGTTSITFRPLAQETTATLVGGTITISNLWVTAATGVIAELTTPGGTMGARLQIAKSVGAGTGSVTLTAVDTSGATVNTDTSVYTVKLVG